MYDPKSIKNLLASENDSLRRQVAELHQQVDRLQAQLSYTNTEQQPAIREAAEYYQIIAEDQTELVSRWNFDGTLLYANEAYYRFFGDRIRQIQQLSPESPIISLEEQLYDQMGTMHYIHWVTRLIFDKHHTAIEIQSVGHDITRRRAAEEALQQAHLELEAKVQARTNQLEELNLALKHEIIERQRAELDLEAHRSFLDRVLNAIPNHVYVKDRQGHFILANKAGAQLYNTTPQNLIGKTAFEFAFDPQQTYQFLIVNQEVMDTLQEKHQVDESFIDVRGQPQHVQTDIIPLINADGKANHVLIVNTDITERKLIEKALLDQQVFLRQVIDMIPSLVFVRDRAGCYILVNEAMAHAVGHTVESMTGKFDAQINPNAQQSAEFHKENMMVMDTRCELFFSEQETRFPDGKTRWVQVNKRPLIDAKGDSNQVVCVLVDITERKLIEKALSEQQAFLRQVIDMIPSMVFVRNRTGQYVLANQSLAHAIGTTVETMIGNLETNFSSDLDQSSTFRDEDLSVMDSLQELFIHEQAVLLSDQKTIWLQIHKRPLVNPQGYSDQVLCVMVDITERKNMAKALEEQRILLKQIFDLAPVSIYVKDRAGRFVLVNQKLAKFYGKSAEELVGAREVDIHPNRELAEFFHRQDLRLMNTLKDLEPQTRPATGVDGKNRWQSTVKRPLVGPDGKANLILCIGSDITKLKETQESMQKQRAFLRQVIDINPSFVFVVDRNGRYILANQALADLYGSTVEDVTGKTIAEMNSGNPEQMQRWLENNASITQDGHKYSTLEDLVQAKDGNTHWMQTYIQPMIGLGRKSGWLIGVSTDISAQYQAREALRESEARYRELFENAPIGIFEIDFSKIPEGMKILRANRKVEALYGSPLEELTQKPRSAIFSAESLPILDHYIEDIRNAKQVSFESVHLRADGSTFPARITITPSPLDGIARATVIIQDISAEKDLNAARQSIMIERERIAREIHRGVVQDLAAMRMRVPLWHDIVDNAPQKMHHELDILYETLKNNIDNTRRSIFALRPVSIEDIGFYNSLREFVEAFNELHTLQAKLTIYGEQRLIPPSIENALFQIIQETLHNAGKHAQAKRVDIRLNLRLVSLVRLTIQDNGIGFDPATLARARLHGHIGIGQIQQQVKDLGGKLHIKSVPGQGTLIGISLPLNVSGS